MIRVSMPNDFLKQWDIALIQSTGQYGIVITKESSTFTLKELNVSKWWLVREIQLWAIKKAFKTLK